MKNLLILFITVMTVGQAIAQKIDYKNNIITVDGTDLAKVNKIKDKENFGITSTYELYSLSGKKLIIATVATEFEPDRNDNSVYYYRFTFLTANQVAVFSLSKLWTEKSFAKLIGAAGIFANDDLNPAMVREFIATKSKNPRIAADYTVAQRDRIYPIVLNEDKTITQESKLIGRFKDITSDSNRDSYEFSLPNGLTVVRISFTGGNNAQNFEVYTVKDNSRRLIPLPTKDKVIMASTPADRNQIALGRILKWMVTNDYL